MKSDEIFEIKATDLGGRIGKLRTKTCEVETPALLPVIHPVRQVVPCTEIKSMGYEAVMTNAYTTYRQLRERANEGIHKIIGFDGTVMTDSGGYQVLEFGSIDLQPEDMAKFEEKLGSDIAIILDKPTGLDVTRRFASATVRETLLAAEKTSKIVSRDDMIWTLPIQGGKYLDLVSKSAKSSAKLDYDCYALGSPVEVMQEYDFSLLVRMIVASKKHLPQNRPFHLFGAGHPLILPLTVALGCDMFDSASYMLYAKQDRYISSTRTIRLEQLEYLGCTCRICTSFTSRELKALPTNERTLALARHNLAMLRQVIEDTKQAIWEGRLWEYAQSACRNHPRAYEAFCVAAFASEKDPCIFEVGTPIFKDRGLFNFDKIDLLRPELRGYRQKLKSIDLSGRKILFILPETKTKPFLKSKIFEELARILSNHFEDVLVTFICPNLGLVPAELSDIFPHSQCTNAYYELPSKDPILNRKPWRNVVTLVTKQTAPAASWLKSELTLYLNIPQESWKLSRKKVTKRGRQKTEIRLAHSYREFKQAARELISSID